MFGKISNRPILFGVLTTLIVGLNVDTACAQDRPDVPEEYQRYFVRYTHDDRSVIEQAYNLVDLTRRDVGRSFALIAGVSYYPRMPLLDRRLDAAAEDVRKLQKYLKDYEFFEEIVVLDNQHVTTENIEYFLQSYFPARMKQFPKSRFLFAYSGHGMTRGNTGYLLKNSASSLNDSANAINLKVIQVYMQDVIAAGHHTLVLLNSCFGGSFIRRPFGGPESPIPQNPGAHAITAGGSGERAWADPAVGSGSIFFEKLYAGLNGRADQYRDGIITAHELATYLRQEVQVSTDQAQNPQFGDISRDGSSGEFFFLDRRRQVQSGLLSEWDPDLATSFGADVRKLVADGRQLYNFQRYDDAYPLFLRAAEAGSSEAMVFVGYLKEKGLGVAHDYGEAHRWYLLAAELGDIIAINNVGVLYRDGNGTEQNYERAVYWFSRGADEDDIWSMSNLGAMYSRGNGVDKDYDLALQYLGPAASGGDAASMAELGWMYRDGLGVPRNLETARDWLERSVESESTLGMVLLGIMYYQASGVTQDYDLAISYFRSAAALNDAWGMSWYAYMLRHGTGTPIDLPASRSWYLRAAQKGRADAMSNVGVMLRLGQGGPRDYPEAFRWLSRAAEDGDPTAMYYLADMYEQGVAVAANRQEAMRWYAKAAEGGHKEAAKALARMSGNIQ